MSKKEPTKRNKKSTAKYDSQHRQNVILEGMSNDIKAIAEGHVVLNQKIDGVASTLNQKIDGVASTLNQKIDGVASTLNQKIDKVADELTYVKVAVLDVGKKVDKLENLENVIQDHEKRIQKLEV